MNFSVNHNAIARKTLRLSKNSFVRSVMVLSSGTAIAHAIQAGSLPILTRVYSPANFQAAAIFQSLLFILSVASCFRFDMAIPLAKSSLVALQLVVLSLLSCGIVAMLTTALLLISPKSLLLLIGDATVINYFWLLPIGILLTGTLSTIQNWHIREKSFSALSYSKIAQTLSLVATQVGSGIASLAPSGLIFGNLMQYPVGLVMLGRQVMRGMNGADREHLYSKSELWGTARQFYKFPLYSTWESLANVASIQLPLVIIGRLAVGPEAGYLLLAMMLMQAPLAILGTAIGQVFLSRSAEHYHAGTLGSFTATTIRSLAVVGTVPLLAIGILSPTVIGTIFGAEWSRAGWLILWMTPWFLMQFLASPTSMVLHVTGHQKDALILQFFGLFIRVAAVLLAYIYNEAFISEAYALSGFVFYLLYLVRVMSCAGCGFSKVLGFSND